MADDGTTTYDSGPLSNDIDSTRDVGISELLRRFGQQLVAEWIHAGCPASVQSYDGTTQKVDVQVLVKDFYRDETGALVVQAVPVITSIPVGFYSSSGGTYQITGPIAQGDIGWIQWADRSMDAWLASQGQQVDPGIYSRFNLTDARWCPGGLPFGAPLARVPTNAMVVGKGQAERIEIGDGYVAMGGAAADCKFIVLDGDTVNAGALSGTVLVSGVPVPVQFTYTPVVGLPVGPSPSAIMDGGQVSSSATIAKGK